MPRLIATRTNQYPLIAEFVFSFNDTMADVNGVIKTFGSTFTDAGAFEVIPLPVGSIITGGELIVETAGVGPTAYTVSVGNSSSATAYLAATSVLSTGRTALTGLGFFSTANNGGNVRITIASTVANATAGKFRVRVAYTIDNRTNETVIV
jgi:hypothetical protein